MVKKLASLLALGTTLAFSQVTAQNTESKRNQGTSPSSPQSEIPIRFYSISDTLSTRERTKFGEIEKEIYNDGYNIHALTTHIKVNEPEIDLEGHFHIASIGKKEGENTSILLYQEKHPKDGSLCLGINEEGILESIYRSKGGNSYLSKTYYNFNDFCESAYITEKTICLTEEEIQAYTRVGHDILEKLENKKTKSEWLQYKSNLKIQEQQKQDSLQRSPVENN